MYKARIWTLGDFRKIRHQSVEETNNYVTDRGYNESNYYVIVPIETVKADFFDKNYECLQ